MLFHGGHGTWLHWLRNIPAWSQRYALWVPDLPGYGDSDALPEASLASLVTVLCEALDRLVGPTTAIALAGFSFGALLAANVAARRASLTRLILIGAAGHGGGRRPSGELKSWREAATRSEHELQQVMRHNLALQMLHSADSVDALAVHIHSDACLRARFDGRPISRAGGLLRALEAHTGSQLLIWGEHDVTAIPDQLAPCLSAGRSGCQTRIVAGAGHWAQYERAEEINALLLAWLAAA